MIETPPALPTASLPNAPLWRRFLARLAEPPRWARRATGWSFSAAFFTALFLVATILSMTWGCKCGPNRHVDRELLDYTRLLSLTAELELDQLGYFLFLIVPITFAAFLSFRLTAGFYRLALTRFGRRGAMIWCTALHTALHVSLFGLFNILRPETFLAPLAIGMIWGAWLPHLNYKLGPDHPNRPFEEA